MEKRGMRERCSFSFLFTVKTVFHGLNCGIFGKILEKRTKWVFFALEKRTFLRFV